MFIFEEIVSELYDSKNLMPSVKKSISFVSCPAAAFGSATTFIIFLCLPYYLLQTFFFYADPKAQRSSPIMLSNLLSIIQLTSPESLDTS